MLTHWQLVVEEEHFLLLLQLEVVILDLGVNFELYDLLQLRDAQVVRNVEPVEKFADYVLVLYDFGVDALYNNSKQRRIFESEILVLDFSLS